jgi:ABC-2 type transport system permease protein
MPLFFASNAIYPISIMPVWPQAAGCINPLTYEVDAIQSLMVRGGSSVYGLALDWGAVLVILVLLTALGARLYGGPVL